MEKKQNKRSFPGRKYKHYAAAVAGAAVLTGAALPGIPVAKAAASEKYPDSPKAKTEQTTNFYKDYEKDKDKDKDKDKKERREHHRHNRRDGWHEHRHSWPGPNENQAWYEDGRVYYRSSNYDRDHYYSYTISSPIELVKDYAAQYGFDRYRDDFKILNLSRTTSVVQVTKYNTGQRFLVYLDRDPGYDWEITAVRAQ
ncbi:putative secreted protein [Propionispora sp. 2/2-37]|uniref:hypothetical protein n=1 Tax=Propionispora sp. 2/2-37 TaxID=1677858 RepID=UPI0006BB87A6|nr:hypothetical protein [Propionispora sp. 2/2-37]CUH94792.1 putative secreted protein [Propionispora sp. 2/2-37]